MNLCQNIQLLEYGGPADFFVKINKIEELRFVLEIARENNIPITIIGNGSNVLVRDKGIRGITIRLNLQTIQIENENVYAEAGVILPKLIRKTLDHELTGLEFACGIPASIGGAVYMNSGAYGCQLSDVIDEVTYLDENYEERIIKGKDASFSYRKSIFQEKNWIIIKVKLKLTKGSKETIESKIENNLKDRISKQPLDVPSAGSVFKRGTNFITAKLIDECGLKGYQIGGAKISEKHAGFIVNSENATAEDVLNLAKFIKSKIKDKYGEDIEMELKVLGEA